MSLSIDDIIKFIVDYKATNGVISTEEQIAKFVGELQEKISFMDFSVPNGTTIIGYTGESNGVGAWKIVKEVSSGLGDDATYISELQAGKLMNNSEFKEALMQLVGSEQSIFDAVTSGYAPDGTRIPNGKCGYGDYLSIDDFVSSKLMGESTGISENLIVFAPEEISPSKVFGTTEVENIFKNNSIQYINGISKSELECYILFWCGR